MSPIRVKEEVRTPSQRTLTFHNALTELKAFCASARNTPNHHHTADQTTHKQHELIPPYLPTIRSTSEQCHKHPPNQYEWPQQQPHKEYTKGLSPIPMGKSQGTYTCPKKSTNWLSKYEHSSSLQFHLPDDGLT